MASPNPAPPGKDPAARTSFLIFLFFLPAFFLIIGGLLLAMQYKQLRVFLSPQPEAIPYLPKSPEEEAQVTAKVRGFFAPAAADSADTLRLSARELNHLIRTSRALETAGWKYHLEMQDTLLTARSSVSARDMKGAVSILLKVMRMHGYFNSSMRGYPRLEAGKIELVPVAATMNGLPAPVSALSRKGNVDPRDWVEDKAFYDQALGRLSEVRVRGGELLLIRKKTAPPGA